jgi:hypothetical protein
MLDRQAHCEDEQEHLNHHRIHSKEVWKYDVIENIICIASL